MRSVKNPAVPTLFALLALAACTPAQGDDTPPGGSEAAAAARETPPAPRAPAAGTAWVVFGRDTVVAEVAATPEERSQGLMYRQEVPDGTGMLFVFQDNAIRSFWMQNTYVALDIAFIDPSYTVVDIQQMEPQTTDPHQSSDEAMFALEVRKGWFAEHGIGVGSRAEIVFGVR